MGFSLLTCQHKISKSLGIPSLFLSIQNPNVTLLLLQTQSAIHKRQQHNSTDTRNAFSLHLTLGFQVFHKKL
jgi:adenylate kinase